MKKEIYGEIKGDFREHQVIFRCKENFVSFYEQYNKHFYKAIRSYMIPVLLNNQPSVN